MAGSCHRERALPCSREVAVASKGGARAHRGVFLTACVGVLTTLVGISTNRATGNGNGWPGPLHLVRDHPWPSVLIFTVLGIAAAIPLWRLSSGSGGESATPGPGVAVGTLDRQSGGQVTQYY